MADRESKTEDPTAKRLADARKKGNVPRSADFTSALIVMSSAVFLLFQWNSVSSIMRQRMVQNLSSFPKQDMTIPMLGTMFSGAMLDAGRAVAPTAFGLLLVGILTSMLQVGILFTTEALKPTLDKINPLNGFKRIFSVRGMFETFKGIVKILVVGWFGYQVVRDRYVQIVTALQLDRAHLGALLGGTAWEIAWRSALALFVLGATDYAYQRWDWFRNLKMSKQEVKDEAKQQDGSPEVKAAIRKRQMQMSRRRMMAEVPQASVVITNPTHYAVAIRYEREGMAVPVVVAKGSDLLAKRIRELAREHDVPLVENKPVAQALFAKVEVGDAIPADMYAVIAEILVTVMRTSDRATARQALSGAP